MSFAENLRKSYRDLQLGWNRLADAAFGKDAGVEDEMARGEFISPFITEGDLTFPRRAPRPLRAPR